MTPKRVIAAVVICFALLIGWQYRGQLADFLSGKDGKPAEAAVAKMFDCWSGKKFDEMSKITFNRGAESELFMNMIKTPVDFTDLKIGQAKHMGDDAWIVPISVKVTDPASVMSSLINAEKMRESMPKLDIDLVLPPKGETLRYILLNQEILVFCVKDKPCGIDVCRDNENCRRKNNLLNYAMDAGRVVVDPDDARAIAGLVDRGEGTETNFRLALWLKHAMDNLGLNKSAAADISGRAQELYFKTPRGKLEIIEAKMGLTGIPDRRVPAEEPNGTF